MMFTKLKQFLFLIISGHHKWSVCWLGLHKWDMPGGHCGHCERCGKYDDFFDNLPEA